MSNPPDGRLTSLSTFTGTISTTDLMEMVSPGNATTGVNYKLPFGTLFGAIATTGAGAPSIAAGTGTLYLRSDATGTTTRVYVNLNGSTNWAAIVTVT